MNAQLSPVVLHELRNPAAPGHRHTQIVRLAGALVRAGFSADEIFARLRRNYDPHSLPDAEIYSAIEWIERNHKVPRNRNKSDRISRERSATTEKLSEKAATDCVTAFLNGLNCSEVELFELSPVRLFDDFRNDFRIVLETLFSEEEKINVVSNYREEAGSNKAQPIGRGIIKSRNQWLDYLRKNNLPESAAGGWLRLNPTNGIGISDCDISNFRLALLESDLLPIEIQLSVLARLPIPICAIVASGGKSLHGWVQINATNAEEYREKVGILFSLVSRFGFDPANRNPSRLARLPGVMRRIGKIGDGRQRLLYLNPNAMGRSIV